jgi:hypothetical protein
LDIRNRNCHRHLRWSGPSCAHAVATAKIRDGPSFGTNQIRPASGSPALAAGRLPS